MARPEAGGTGRTRYGIVLVGVAVVGLAAGALIAGLPTEVPSDIQASDIDALPTTTTTEPPAPTTDEPVATTDAADTTEPETSTTTEPPTTTTTSTTSTTAPASPRPITQVSVVVANGGGANGLAGEVRDDLRAEGYVDISATNATERFQTSVVYFEPGSQPEAARLAAQLGIAAVEAAPADVVTENGTSADVVIVLGGDRI